MTKLVFNVEIATDVYSEAQRKCGEASGHLLDLRSPYLSSALNQLQPFYSQGQLKPSNVFSTGLRRTEPGAETFTWYDGQLDIDSFNRTYYYYLPEDDAQDCVSLKWSKSSKQWVLKITDCNVAYPWICQIQTSEHCSYCPHPDTKLTSTTISENSKFLAPSACQDTCTNAASMPEPEMHCWFYAYNAGTSACVTFRDPELVDTVESDSWQQTDPDWDMYEKQCISVRIVRNGVVEDQSDNCSLPLVEIIPKTEIATTTTTTAIKTSNSPQETSTPEPTSPDLFLSSPETATPSTTNSQTTLDYLATLSSATTTNSAMTGSYTATSGPATTSNSLTTSNSATTTNSARTGNYTATSGPATTSNSLTTSNSATTTNSARTGSYTATSGPATTSNSLTTSNSATTTNSAMTGSYTATSGPATTSNSLTTSNSATTTNSARTGSYTATSGPATTSNSLTTSNSATTTSSAKKLSTSNIYWSSPSTMTPMTTSGEVTTPVTSPPTFTTDTDNTSSLPPLPACRFPCQCRMNRSTEPDFDIAELLNHLRLDHRKFSFYVRKYSSAADDRVLSRAIGWTAILLLVSALLLILALDSTALYRDFNQMRHNMNLLLKRSE